MYPLGLDALSDVREGWKAPAERAIDAEVATEVWLGRRDQDQVVAPESPYLPVCGLLDGYPGVPLKLELVFLTAAHVDVVVDQLVVGQNRAGGVQALEDLLGTRIGQQADRDLL